MRAEGPVTVVVMTRDRWADLRRTLARHEAPVIVVDNGSTDGTPDLVRQHFPGVTVVELGRNLGAVARNVGVQLAPTPYVAFADDDSWWEPGALEAAAEILDQYPALAVLAAKTLLGDGRLDPVCLEMAASSVPALTELPGPAVLGFLACAAVVRREAFLEVGGFDDVVFFMGEEERVTLDLAARGWALAYVDTVVARHDPSASRNRRARRIRAARNRLLTAVMRRPWRVVLRRLWSTGTLAALPRLPAALRQRRRLPRHVEEALAVLQDADRLRTGRPPLTGARERR